MLTQPTISLEFAFVAKRDDQLSYERYDPRDMSTELTRTLFGEDPLSLSPALSNSYAILEPHESIDYGHLLLINIELAERKGKNTSLMRRWKPVVVLKHDTESQLFLEITRVELAERHVILVHESMTERVLKYLENAAMPGFQALDNSKIQSVPPGWILFKDVRIGGFVDPESDDLQSLVPVAATSIIFSDGLSLPQRNSWHVRHPPSVHVASLTSKNLTAKVIGLPTRETKAVSEGDSDEIFYELDAFSNTLSKDLSDLDIVEGDYRIVVTEAMSARESEATIASAALRLRSGDDTRSPTTGLWAHCLDLSPDTWTIDTDTINGENSSLSFVSGSVVRGIEVRGAQQTIHEIPTSIHSGEYEDVSERQGISRDGDSAVSTVPTCLVRKHHIWELPPAAKYPPRYQELRGRCKDCGLEKWFGGRFRKKRSKKKKRSAKTDSFTEIRKIISLPQMGALTRIEFDEIFDAMVYLREGTISNVKMLLDQMIGPNVWIAEEMLRNLFSLAHCEIALDDDNERIESWQITTACINFIEKGRAFLSGVHNKTFLNRLSEDVAAINGRVKTFKQSEAPTRIEIQGLEYEDLCEISESLAKVCGENVEVARNPGRTLAAILPPITQIMTHLSVRSWPHAATQLFDLSDLRWIDVGRPDRPGAYRFRHWRTDYGYIGENELRDGIYRRGEYRLVKHLAATMHGRPLFAYDDIKRIARVPLGAQLPWLYERALVLESGAEPTKLSNGYVEYQSVTPETASMVWKTLLDSVYQSK
jgi:hypothetical protein